MFKLHIKRNHTACLYKRLNSVWNETSNYIFSCSCTTLESIIKHYLLTTISKAMPLLNWQFGNDGNDLWWISSIQCSFSRPVNQRNEYAMYIFFCETKRRRWAYSLSGADLAERSGWRRTCSICSHRETGGLLHFQFSVVVLSYTTTLKETVQYKVQCSKFTFLLWEWVKVYLNSWGLELWMNRLLSPHSVVVAKRANWWTCMI